MLPFIERATASVVFDPTLGLTLEQQIGRFLPTIGFEQGNTWTIGTADRIAYFTALNIDQQIALGETPTLPSFEQGQLPEGLLDWTATGYTPVTEMP